MNEIFLFTDVSLKPKSKIGFGAYLTVTDKEIPVYMQSAYVKVKRFENTSSTKLELQTLLWALSEIQPLNGKIISYTDSQNIIGLQRRRDRFEQNGYRSNNNKLLKNHSLYKEFFKVTDKLNFELIKVSGHKALNQKDYIDQCFTFVDKASRKAMKTKL